jgi:hypothetical protein
MFVCLRVFFAHGIIIVTKSHQISQESFQYDDDEHIFSIFLYIDLNFS